MSDVCVWEPVSKSREMKKQVTASDFVHTEISLEMSYTLVLRTTKWTPVRKQRCPLRRLRGPSGVTKKKGYF